MGYGLHAEGPLADDDGCCEAVASSRRRVAPFDSHKRSRRNIFPIHGKREVALPELMLAVSRLD